MVWRDFFRLRRGGIRDVWVRVSFSDPYAVCIALYADGCWRDAFGQVMKRNLAVSLLSQRPFLISATLQ